MAGPVLKTPMDPLGALVRTAPTALTPVNLVCPRLNGHQANLLVVSLWVVCIVRMATCIVPTPTLTTCVNGGWTWLMLSPN